MKVIMGLRLYYEVTATPICIVAQAQSSYMVATRYPRADPGTMGEFYGIRSQGLHIVQLLNVCCLLC
jgi:hypothetical protein